MTPKQRLHPRPVAAREPLDLKPLEWHRICVTTESATDTSPGAIEEAHFAIDSDEILFAELDGRIMSVAQLEPGEDAAAVARRLLRGKVSCLL